MADYLHQRIYIGTHQAICIAIDRPANVILLTDPNFTKYKRHQGGYSYYGGEYRTSPVIIYPPRAGYYNLVIDLGASGGQIRTSDISIIDV
jgi:hypothetical protein